MSAGPAVSQNNSLLVSTFELLMSLDIESQGFSPGGVDEASSTATIEFRPTLGPNATR